MQYVVCKRNLLMFIVFLNYSVTVKPVEVEVIKSVINEIITNQTVVNLPFNASIGKTFWMKKDETIKEPLDMNIYNYNQFGDFKKHPCRRVCQQGQPMTCYYRMVVHNYQRLGTECQRCLYDPKACTSEYCIYGDGIPNGVVAVNRMVPGPAIEVCENDIIMVDTLNYLTEEFTMHWHGMHMSQTPEMDGSPFITQYPIQAGEMFRYNFQVDRSGTLWYHSHSAWQRALGLAGALVIRQTKQANRQAHLYDYDLIDHTIMLQDVIYNYDFERPHNIFINGKGRNHINALPDNDPSHRYELLQVTQGMRYRMRVISNGVFTCPLEFSIEDHRMLLISTDGNDIEPVSVDKFFLVAAERFDFILYANQYPGNYWIRVKGYNDCQRNNLYQGAILNYRGTSRTKLPTTEISNPLLQQSVELPVVYNNLHELLFTKALEKDTNGLKATNVAITGLRSLTPLRWPAYTKFKTYYSSFNTEQRDNGESIYKLDEISFVYPTVALLHARHLYNDDSVYCNRSALEAAGHNCYTSACQCTQVLRVPLNKPIEMVVTNYLQATHPFHIHGNTFRLVGQAVLDNVQDLRKIKQLDRAGRLQRLPDDYPAVEKDTVQVPGLGYIIIRFYSSNPGFWLFHCHILPHNIGGMAAVLKVGENHEIKMLPPRVKC